MCCAIELSLELALPVLPPEDTAPKTMKDVFRFLGWAVCVLWSIWTLAVTYSTGLQGYPGSLLFYTPIRSRQNCTGRYHMARKKSTNGGGTGVQEPTPPPEPPERITGLECYEYSKLTEHAGRA